MSVLKIKPTPKGEGGTTVVANPTLEGTEPNLTGLEVEGTKYKVPEGGGSRLYYAHIYFMDDDSYSQQITIQVDDNTLETYNDLYTYLQNKGFVSDNTDNRIFYLNGCGSYNGTSSLVGISIDKFYDEEKTEWFDRIGCMSINGNEDLVFIRDDEEFSITYLGQD